MAARRAGPAARFVAVPPQSKAFPAIDVTASFDGTDRARARPARLPRSRPRGPVLWVLLIVVGLATVGITGMAVSSRGGKAASSPPATTQSLGLPARPAGGNFSSVGASTQVPSDVLSAVYVPRTASMLGRADQSRGVGTFDATVDFRTPASYDRVVSFFKAELTGNGWSLKSQGPATNASGEELLAWRAGSDGNYWEVGAVVALPSSAATYSGQSTQAVGGPTSFSLRLFEVQLAE